MMSAFEPMYHAIRNTQHVTFLKEDSDERI
jgi:hypothetical protein